jgi:inhibitor of KinA
LINIVESIGTEMSFDINQLNIDPISERVLCISGPEIISIELHQFLLGVCEQLHVAHFPEIDQIVPAYHTITIILKDSASSIKFADELIEWFKSARQLPKSPSNSAHKSPTAHRSPLTAPSTSHSPLPTSYFPLPTSHVIPVHYGGEFGPDLEDFAKAKGLSPREVINLHTSVEYYVYMIGFTAGFPYLGGLPTELHRPRRDEPRVHVPAGSVGIGGAQTGVYPHEAPGGWHLIGRTDLSLFDVDRSPPALLKPGDRVRFTEVTL